MTFWRRSASRAWISTSEALLQYDSGWSSACSSSSLPYNTNGKPKINDPSVNRPEGLETQTESEDDKQLEKRQVRTRVCGNFSDSYFDYWRWKHRRAALREGLPSGVVELRDFWLRK